MREAANLGILIMNTYSEHLTSLATASFGQAKLEETPIAVCINGISYAVMMASPYYLHDFALGFALSEGLIESLNEVLEISTTQCPQGFEVNIDVLARTEHTLKHRRRLLSGSTGCGLCGIDSIENAMSLPPPITSTQETVSSEVIEQAKATLTSIQKQHHCIQGHHSAVYFDMNANPLAIREDVGRHSALDKLIGCLHTKKLMTKAGFVLLTSRCSHDLVLKAARCKLSTLVTLAQPTNLAVSSAKATKLRLFSFVHGELTQFS
jgi:FdhD protein